MGAPQLEKISAFGLVRISMITTGQMESHVTLESEILKIHGTINGHSLETETQVEKLYALYSYIDSLELARTTVPPGKPPRGCTKFVLEFKDGSSLLLGLNLNEQGLEYYELSIGQFQQLQDLWMNL